MVSSRSATLVPIEHIASSILVLRGQKVLLDTELTALYGVTTAAERAKLPWSKPPAESIRNSLVRIPLSLQINQRPSVTPQP
ncbi:MAG TPA: hypothetical protein VHV80_02535 [Steroidobacteraceae bacterium]|jgi:hypothetical protein|nr:hypothetical protein [Steroidobacteraceae bacterium]